MENEKVLDIIKTFSSCNKSFCYISVKTIIMKNPRWHKDELILALDLYFELNHKGLDKNNPLIKDLSELLNSLPIHDKLNATVKFRNVNGVVLKLCNFLAIDPTYNGVGMKSYSQNDKSIFDEFVDDREQLARLSTQIKSIVKNADLVSKLSKVETEDIQAKEGGVIYKLHKFRERNQSLIRKKKESYLKTHSCLNCEICGFNFKSFYGDLGEGFIECHHIKQLSQLDVKSMIGLEDLILVCSNCHRMLHRGLNTITIEGLRMIVNSANEELTL